MQEGGNTFEIPDAFTNAFTIQTQATQGAEVTTNDPVSVKVQLAINTHKYVAYLIGDKDMRQLARIYDFNAIYSRKAGRALADALDAAIAALWSNISTNTVGTTSAAVTDLQIRQSIGDLDSTFYPLDELSWFIHPTVFWNQIVAIQKYYDVGQSTGFNGPGPVRYGGIADRGNGAGQEGFKGVLYGVPVHVTANIVNNNTSYRNLLLHRDAFSYGVQTPGAEHVRVQVDYALRNIGMLTVVDIVYGVKTTREPGAVLLNAGPAQTTA